MSDFLKNLRTSQRGPHNRQMSATRRDIDGHYYPHPDRRRMTRDRRTTVPPQNKSNQSPESLGDSLSFIKENIVQIASCMERVAETKESLAKVKKGQHQAIWTFFQLLNQILVEKIIPSLENSTLQHDGGNGRASHSPGSLHSKEKVIAIIKTMRGNHSTFAEIAEHLKEEGIPTFSGRGEWHAQTIHRLCK